MLTALACVTYLEQMAEAHGSIGAPTVVSWTARSKLPPEPPPRPLVLLGAHLVFISAVLKGVVIPAAAVVLMSSSTHETKRYSSSATI